MSYYRRDSEKERHLVDRLPVYVFPAFVGSGRILLGMALAGFTTALLMKHSALLGSMMWWLAACAYIASLLLSITGVYSINYLPPAVPKKPLLPPEVQPPRPPITAPLAAAPATVPPAATPPRTHLGDLLVDRWNVLTREQLLQAQQRQEESGASLAHELTGMGLLTDEQLEHMLEVQAEAQDPWYGASRTS